MLRILLCFLFITSALPVIAQENQLSNEEENNEITDPFAEQFGLFTKTVREETSKEKSLPGDESKQVLSLSEEEDTRAIPVKGIGVIVEASNTSKAKAVLANYYRLIKNVDIQPSLIYVVLQDVNNIDLLNELMLVAQSELNRGLPPLPDLEKNPNLETEIMQHPGVDFNSKDFIRRLSSAFTLIPVPSVPEEYKEVKTFPTWYLYTDKGQILLEGLDDPSSMITKSGKFVEPVGVDGQDQEQNQDQDRGAVNPK